MDVVAVTVPSRIPRYKVYRRRWFMLALFTLYSFCNATHWLQYCIISNVVSRYYGVTSYAVDSTSIVYMLAFTPFIFPASSALSSMGLRNFVLLGAAGTALGSWIKCLSVRPDLFSVSLLGQTLAAVSQVFILSVPPQLAAVWFGSEEVSTACSLAVFGNQLGIAASFILTPLAVTNHPNLDDIGVDLQWMFYISAGFCTFIFILIFAFFQEKPPLPPSAEMLRRQPTSSRCMSSMCRLLVNHSFVLLTVSFSINIAVFSALSTLLNQLVLLYFQNAEVFAGRIGLIFIVSGMVGTVVCGVILDKSHTYKETSVALYAISTFSFLAFTFVLQFQSQAVVYGVATVLGTFTVAFMPVSFEFASELTYPESEASTAGLMVAASQVLGILVTVGYAWLMATVGDIWANLCLCALLVLGNATTALIPCRLRRQAAHIIALKEEDQELEQEEDEQRRPINA